MHLTIGEQHLRLATTGAGLHVAGQEFGPLAMLGASLALCTASVVHAYAETAHLELAGIEVEVRWDYAEDPHRVSAYALTLHLPTGVPAARRPALLRAAETCTVHNTLVHPVRIGTALAELSVEGTGAAAH